jgi:molecular chaperone GrpE (heat shock protein)
LWTALRGLLQRFDERLGETAACNREAFDRLYEEMRAYKENFLLSAQRPLLADVMALYDDILQLKKHYASAQTVDLPTLCDNLDGLLVGAEELLARRELLPICEHGAKLNRDTQKAVKVVPAADPSEDMTVVERLKTGFLFQDKVFRREEVVVKKYSA